MADVVVLPSKGESEVSEAIVVSACLIGMFTRIGKGGTSMPECLQKLSFHR